MRKPKAKTVLSIKTTVLVCRVCIVVGLMGTIYSSNIIRLPDTNEGIIYTRIFLRCSKTIETVLISRLHSLFSKACSPPYFCAVFRVPNIFLILDFYLLAERICC